MDNLVSDFAHVPQLHDIICRRRLLLIKASGPHLQPCKKAHFITRSPQARRGLRRRHHRGLLSLYQRLQPLSPSLFASICDRFLSALGRSSKHRALIQGGQSTALPLVTRPLLRDSYTHPDFLSTPQQRHKQRTAGPLLHASARITTANRGAQRHRHSSATRLTAYIAVASGTQPTTTFHPTLWRCKCANIPFKAATAPNLTSRCL